MLKSRPTQADKFYQIAVAEVSDEVNILYVDFLKERTFQDFSDVQRSAQIICSCRQSSSRYFALLWGNDNELLLEACYHFSGSSHDKSLSRVNELPDASLFLAIGKRSTDFSDFVSAAESDGAKIVGR